METEKILMGQKQLQRWHLMKMVEIGRITLKEASERIGVSYRQAKRIGRAIRERVNVTGFELHPEEIGYQVAGRKIEFIVEDDEVVSSTGLTKTRKLVEKDGVHIMTGALMASTGYALAPYTDPKEIPMTYPIMAPFDLTQRQRAKWIVRTRWASSQPHQPFVEYAYNVLKFRKVSVIAYVLPLDRSA